MAGAVLDGGVRDISEIRRDYDFPVIARAASLRTTAGRFRTVASNLPVRCGGIEVSPGDLIVGDIDGVVVVPQRSTPRHPPLTGTSKPRRRLRRGSASTDVISLRNAAFAAGRQSPSQKMPCLAALIDRAFVLPRKASPGVKHCTSIGGVHMKHTISRRCRVSRFVPGREPERPAFGRLNRLTAAQPARAQSGSSDARKSSVRYRRIDSSKENT